LTWKLKERILKILAKKKRERERKKWKKGIKLYLIGFMKLLLN
jgi:hypothetical protein